MQSSQLTAERIKNMAKERNISISKVLFDCDMNKNALFTMQTSGYYPRVEAIIKIADYFDCSVDYLLGRTDIPEVNRGYEASEEFYRDDLQLVAFGGDFKGKPKKKETQTT